MCKFDKESGLLPQAKFEMAGFRNREGSRKAELLQNKGFQDCADGPKLVGYGKGMLFS